jgi:hypothetical protein
VTPARTSRSATSSSPLLGDVKGDLSGISQAGKSSPKFDARVAALGLLAWVIEVLLDLRWCSGMCLGSKECGADDGEHRRAAVDSGGAGVVAEWVFEAIDRSDRSSRQ